MITIRPSQIEALDQLARRRFVVRKVAHLRRTFPDDCRAETDEALEARVLEGIRRAATHDLTSERDVSDFIDLDTILEPRFDRTLEWVQEILLETGTPPTERLARVKEIAEGAALEVDAHG